jgi:hypothetical protein
VEGCGPFEKNAVPCYGVRRLALPCLLLEHRGPLGKSLKVGKRVAGIGAGIGSRHWKQPVVQRR